MDNDPRAGIRKSDHDLFHSIGVVIWLVKRKQDGGFGIVPRDRYQVVRYDGEIEVASGVRACPEQIYQITALQGQSIVTRSSGCVPGNLNRRNGDGGMWIRDIHGHEIRGD